jgi:hypothetical protein
VRPEDFSDEEPNDDLFALAAARGGDKAQIYELSERGQRCFARDVQVSRDPRGTQFPSARIAAV